MGRVRNVHGPSETSSIIIPRADTNSGRSIWITCRSPVGLQPQHIRIPVWFYISSGLLLRVGRISIDGSGLSKRGIDSCTKSHNATCQKGKQRNSTDSIASITNRLIRDIFHIDPRVFERDIQKERLNIYTCWLIDTIIISDYGALGLVVWRMLCIERFHIIV